MPTFAIWVAAGLALVSAPAPEARGLAALVGRYKITAGASGTVEIGPALGGSFYELRVVFTDVPHELRYLIATAEAGGARPVWRFEAEPAPAVRNEGIVRFEGNELIAEFPHKAAGSARVLRERWKVNATGELDFALETISGGAVVRRVGNFTASRQ